MTIVQTLIYFYKEMGVSGLMQKSMIGSSPPPLTPLPFPLRAQVKVSGWWGMVNIMEPGKIEKYLPLNPSPPKLKRKKCKAHSMCA